jgi:predicted DNA-binding transcriptional regulator YafY
MPDRITKTQRWLDLIAFLLGRRFPVPVDEIMDGVPAYAGADTGDERVRCSVRRMFERDKDELRTLGIPIETVSYTLSSGAEAVEGYQLARRDFYLPYLKLLAEQPGTRSRAGPGDQELELSADEAGLALDAVRRVADLPGFPYAEAAHSAFRKLSFDLDSERLASPSVLWVDPPNTGELLERLRLLSGALLARKRVRFAYRGIQRGQTTARAVAPYGLFFQRDWYLVGHDEARGALRSFRVARMDDVRPNTRAPKTPDFELPSEFRLEQYLRREAWELGVGDEPSVHALVRFRFPASILAARQGRGELVEQHADGSAVRRFELQQIEPFLRWVLSQEGEAEIVGPPDLRAALHRMTHAVAALYGTEEAHG